MTLPLHHITAQVTESVLRKSLSWSQTREYCGYNKHDGLNSPILNTFLGWGKWPRMIAIQGIMRFPVNLRPLLLTKKSYNPKGLALFVQSWLHLYQVSKDENDLNEAKRLLALLDELSIKQKFSGECWGYHYPWRDPGFYAPANTPNAVVTAFVCEAFLEAFEITGDTSYLQKVKNVIPFFLNDLTILKDEENELCLSYMPMPMTMRVMDVSILIGSVLARCDKLSKSMEHQSTAYRLVNFVVQRQTVEGAWFYTDPPEDSHIRHDNYHTGFILDALDRYKCATEDFSWTKEYEKGLKFYAEKLFNDDGSPRWMSDKDYPHDIHGAAQGIITFSRHKKDYPGLAEKISRWTTQNMYSSDGRFYYQKTPYFTKKLTLMRWSNGWMCRALSDLLRSSNDW